MLQVSDEDKRGAAQHDEHSGHAVQIVLRQLGVVGFHDQGDLRDDKTQPEERDSRAQPGQVRAVVCQLAVHCSSQLRVRTSRHRRLGTFRSTRTMTRPTSRECGVEEPGAPSNGALDERFRRALDSILDLVVIERAVRDAAGEIVDFEIEWMNNAPVDVAGRPREELIGRRISELYPVLAGGELIAGYRQVVETGEPLVVEVMPYEDVIDGRPVSGYYTVQASKFEDGVLVASRDISSLEGSRRDLETALQELEAAQRLAQLGVWRLDLKTGGLVLSTEMQRMYGLTGDDPTGFGLAEARAGDPPRRPWCRAGGLRTGARDPRRGRRRPSHRVPGRFDRLRPELHAARGGGVRGRRDVGHDPGRDRAGVEPRRTGSRAWTAGDRGDARRVRVEGERSPEPAGRRGRGLLRAGGRPVTSRS